MVPQASDAALAEFLGHGKRTRTRTRTNFEKVLQPVRPNAGLQAIYRARLDKLIGQMNDSYVWFLSRQYRKTPPRMAEDATPAKELERKLRDLGHQWERRFDEAAPLIARWFAMSVNSRSQRQLQQILKNAGWAVDFKVTPLIRDVLDATVSENVGLIRSIASQYHSQVEGLVMRSVTAGRDLSFLTDELQDRYLITRRRAKLIALDQNNKATSQINRAKQQQVGIEEGVWMHSHAGKEPRPTHKGNDRKRFSLKEGWYDPDPKVRKHIWPGELIRCRCTWKPVVKGFS